MIAKLLVPILSVFLSSILYGQDLNRLQIESVGDLTQPPADHFLDLGEIFFDNPKPGLHLMNRLVQLEEEHGFTVYFVAYAGIIGSNVEEKAAKFRDLWLEEGEEGLVLVCDTDMRQLGYSLTKAGELSPEGEGRTWKVADHEIMAILSELSQSANSEVGAASFTNGVGNRLLDQLEESLQDQAAAPKSSLGLLGVFAFCVVSLFLLLMFKPLKKRESNVSEISFPQIHVSERLGAAYGGGLGGEIQVQISVVSTSDS